MSTNRGSSRESSTPNGARALGRAGQDQRVTYLSDSPADADLLARVRADVRPLRAHFNHAGASLTPAPVFGADGCSSRAGSGGRRVRSRVAGRRRAGRVAGPAGAAARRRCRRGDGDRERDRCLGDAVVGHRSNVRILESRIACSSTSSRMPPPTRRCIACSGSAARRSSWCLHSRTGPWIRARWPPRSTSG